MSPSPTMSPFCRIVVAVALALLPGAAAQAGPQVETAGATPCSFEAWSRDPDPDGLNVRAAPRRDAPVIGRLPAPATGGGDSYAVEFTVVGGRDGWFLIEDARFEEYAPGLARPVFGGPGWVAANLTAFTINAAALQAEPRDDSDAVAQLMGTDASGGMWGPDSVEIAKVHGCRGAWADVTVKDPNGRTTRGWATQLCSNQVTTCP